jgi:hypothetical protein
MFDDIIRNKANNHEAPIPPDAWNNIIKRPGKRRFGFFWWSRMLLLIAALSVTGYLINKKTNRVIATAESKQSPVAKKDEATNAVTIATTASNSTNSEQTTSGLKATNNNSDDAIAGSVTGNLSSPTYISNKHASVKITAAVPGEMDNDVIETNERHRKKNRSMLITQNSIKKKRSGKARYNTDAGVAEEITTTIAAEKRNNSVTDSDAIQKETANNSTMAAIKQNNDIAAADTTNPSVKEEKKTTTTEINKENTALTKQTNQHHWYIDAGITPTLPVQQYDEHLVFNRTLFLNNSRTTYTAKLAKTSIDPSMAFSIAVRRELNKKWMIGAGLQYLLLKETIAVSGNETTTQYNVVQRLVNGAAGPQLLNDTVTTVTEGTRDITAVNSYHLYGIPLFVQYSLIQKRSWSLNALAGMYINIWSSYQNEINHNATALLTSTDAADKTSVGYDLFAGLRLGKSIGNKVEFFVLPSMRWGLQPYRIKNSLLNKSIDQVGFTVGISYKLK